MIFGYEEEQIVQKATSCQNYHFDGVVQYNYKTGELFGCSMSQNETENPANPFIEVFRLHQGERGEINYGCYECPFSEDSDEHTECCIDAYVSDDFTDDFNTNFYESVERQVRDVISDYVGNTLEKLNEIRIALSDIVTPYNYFNVRQEDWVGNAIDYYVDSAMDDGFCTTVTTPLGWVEGEIEHIATAMEFDDDPEIQKCANLVRDGKFEEVLALLQ